MGELFRAGISPQPPIATIIDEQLGQRVAFFNLHDSTIERIAEAVAKANVTVDDAMVDRLIAFQKERVPGGDAYLSRAEWKTALQFAITGQES